MQQTQFKPTYRLKVLSVTILLYFHVWGIVGTTSKIKEQGMYVITVLGARFQYCGRPNPVKSS